MQARTSPNKPNSENNHNDLMAFFNAVDEVFFTSDFIDSKIVRISDACENLFGYTAEDFRDNYLLWRELVHPEDQHIVSNQNELLQSGTLVNSQYRIIHKDSSIKWVEKKISPILDNKGRLVRLDGVLRDITERKEDEVQHRNSESLYRNIIETAQEGIWTIDEFEKTNFVNQKICKMFGYTYDEMLGKSLFDFMDEEGRVQAKANIARRHSGVKENFDIRYITKAGKDLWANISTNPIFDEQGSYKGALAMVTDMTNRRAEAEALKKSEANLRTVFDSTDTAYILIGASLDILSFNALAQKYSEDNNGISLEVNRSIVDYFPSGRWPLVKQMLDKVAEGEPANYEINITSDQEQSKWYNIRWLNVKNSEGKNWGFVLANKDITEAKYAALEREKITADLIQRNSDLEQFTYIVSHNLRAPVANIIGLSDMLGDDDVDSGTKQEIMTRITQSIKHIDIVISDLNHILQTRAVNEKKEIVFLAKLVESIKTSIYNAVPDEKVELIYDFAPLESMFIIRSYAYSIFYNLISNSIKYRKADTPSLITISSTKQDGIVELRFKDNGKGIDLEKNGDQLFGLYKRFDTVTEGKGMGLFMVKTQVEALGGTIHINSKLNEGTEFVIRFSLQSILPTV